MHSWILDLGFGFLKIFEVFEFFFFVKFFGLGCVDLVIYAHALHSHYIITMFMHFRCVIDYCCLSAARFGLGFYL